MFKGLPLGADAFLRGFKGCLIREIHLDYDANNGQGELIITFDTGKQLVIYDSPPKCCEHRYLHTSDDLSSFAGEKFVDLYCRGFKENEHGNDEANEIGFYVIKTDKGQFVLETHNDHNGYYGGFHIQFMGRVLPEFFDGM